MWEIIRPKLRRRRHPCTHAIISEIHEDIYNTDKSQTLVVTESSILRILIRLFWLHESYIPYINADWCSLFILVWKRKTPSLEVIQWKTFIPRLTDKRIKTDSFVQKKHYTRPLLTEPATVQFAWSGANGKVRDMRTTIDPNWIAHV